MLKWSLQKFCNWVNCYWCLSYVQFVIVTIPFFFLHSWCITRFLTLYCLSYCLISFDCPIVLFLLAIVLTVLLSYFFWPLYCLSYCLISFGHCIVCPIVLFLLAIVLTVLLSYFFWPLYWLSYCLISFGHCIDCPIFLFLLAIVLSVLLRFIASGYP
jgi:hypothetical protein